MNKNLKVLSSAALASALAVPAVAGVAPTTADAAESITQVAFEAEDGTVYVVDYNEYADAILAGEGELFDAIQEGTVTAVGVGDNVFVDYLALADAKLDSPDTDTITLLDELDDDEANLVDEDTVANYDQWGEDDEEVTVESVSAINPSTVEVTFNQEVEGLDKSSFSVMTEDGTKQYVKSVSLDGDTATISFYEALETDTTYDIAITDGETTWETSLDYVLGDVAEIEADTSQTVAASDSYDLTNLDYTVLDENGQDITEITNVQFETTFDDDTNSTVDLNPATTGFVYVTATDDEGNQVRSERITLTSEAPEVAQITDYSVGDSNSLDFDADNYMQDTVVQLGEDGQYLNVDSLDQFGNDYTGDVTFESLDKSVALVDRNTGKITPIAEGTVPVKVTVDGEITTTVELEVVADAQLSAFDLSEDTLSVSDSVSAPTTVNFTARDQYEGKFTTLSENDIDVEVTSGTDLVEANLESYANGEGVINVTGQEAGTATVTITSGDVEQELTVNVVEAGETEGYEVEGFETQLDQYADPDDDTSADTTMNVAVYPVDANGVKTGDEITNATYTVTKEDGTAVEGYNDVSVGTAIDAADFEAGKDYTVSVEVGSFDVFEDTFSVVDTEPKPYVELTSSNLTDEDGDGNLDNEIQELIEVYFAGEEVTTGSVDEITIQSDNESLVQSGTYDLDGDYDSNDLDDVELQSNEGEASLVITEVKVEDGDNGSTFTYNDTIDVNEIVNVTEGVTSPEGDVTETLTFDSATVDQKLFMAYGNNNADGNQAVESLSDIKDYIEEEYPGVTFNTDGITFSDSDSDGGNDTISIDNDTPILSSEDWNTIKASGDTSTPYRITLVADETTAPVAPDSEDKLAKIAIYEDGTATLEDETN